MSYVISDEEVRGGVPIRSFLNACQNPRVGERAVLGCEAGVRQKIDAGRVEIWMDG